MYKSKIIVFFIITAIWGYFSFPTQILELVDANDLPTGKLGFTDEAAGYLRSYLTSLGLTLGSLLIGFSLGFILAILRFMHVKILTFVIDEYIDIIRGTPVLLQLLIFALVIFSGWSDNFYVAIIAFGLNSSAYTAEIVRSGIQSVDKGQMEAARAMGLGYGVSMKEVILPQAFKNILPALINEFISLFKETSVVGYISVMDITMKAQSLQAIYYSPKPIIFTGLIYYVSVKLFTVLGYFLEKKLARGDG